MSVENEMARTAFVAIHAKVMRSGITLRSPSEMEHHSSDSVATSECAEDEVSLFANPSSSACNEQTARQATNSHNRHTGNVSARPRFSKASMTVNIQDLLAHLQLALSDLTSGKLLKLVSLGLIT